MTRSVTGALHGASGYDAGSNLIQPVESFILAESAEHKRELSPIDHQNVIREARDNLYSAAVSDLEP